MPTNKTITAANAVFAISITNLIPAPVQLQGFTADDIFDTEPLETGEFIMGVDGRLSGGMVFAPQPMNISLMPDSDSNVIFDTWYSAQRQPGSDLYFANAVVILPGLGTTWILEKGGLRTYQAIPSLKKTVAPRVFGLVWQTVRQAPV